MKGNLNSVFDLIRALNKEELNRLDDYIHSPYYNKSDVISRLYAIILKHAPGFESKSLSNEKLYKKLYPGKQFNEKSIRSRLSELSHLVKGFYMMLSFEMDEFNQRKYMIKQYRLKGLFAEGEKKIEETAKYLDELGYADQDAFRDRAELLNQSTKMKNARDLKPAAVEIAYKRTEIIIDCFFYDFLLNEHMILLGEIEQNIKIDFDFLGLFYSKFDFEGFLEELRKADYKHYPVLAIPYYGNLTLKKPENEKYFYQLKKLIIKHHKNFHLNALYNYWSLLSNAAFVNYLQKGKEFLIEGHEINRFFIDNLLYDESKPFSAMAYQNTIINALMIGEIEWAEKFGIDFKEKLTSETKENRFNFCMAMISFEKKEYEVSLKFLSKVIHADWHFKVTIRMYYLMNYYELNWHDQFTSLLDSFRHFAAEGKSVPEYMDERIKRALQYFNKLAASKFDGKPFDYADYKEAEQMPIFSHKEWILKKMKELMNRSA